MAEGAGLTAPLDAGGLHASRRWFVALEAALFLLALTAALNLAIVAVASTYYVGALSSWPA